MAIRKLNQLGLYSAITIPQMNGEAHTLLITHVVKEQIGTADILELAAIPADMKLLDAVIDTEGAGTTNLTVGIMSGKPNDPDPARTSGSELFNAVAAGTETKASIKALAAIARNPGNRSIGHNTSAAIPVGAKIHLRLTYGAQPTHNAT